MRTRRARSPVGSFGAPTFFFVGEEMFFGKDKLGDVKEEIVLAKARA